jgi:hypothetical protein
MPTKLEQRDHTQAVITALEGAGLTVGRGIRNTEPDGSGDTLPPPCVVVHPLPGGRRFGTMDDWTLHADLMYQITCVGATQAQAEWLRDQTEVLLDGITVAGRHIDIVKHENGSDGAMRDETIQGEALFVSFPQYRVSSSPA